MASVLPSSSSTCISPILEISGDCTETGTTGRRTRAQGIRATPAQATLLKEEYKESNILTSEKAKILSEKTGLPIKWINQWFSRKRSKDRKDNPTYKAKAKARTSNLPDSSSDPDGNSLLFSLEDFDTSCATGAETDIATVKREYRDLSFLASGSVHARNMSPPLRMSTSEFISASVTADHFPKDLELGDRFLAQEPTTRNAEKTTLKGRKGASSRARKKEKELEATEPSRMDETLPLEPSIVAPPTDALSLYGHLEKRETQSPLATSADAYTRKFVAPEGQTTFPFVPHGSFLRGIAPPKRSPRVALNKAVVSSGSGDDNKSQTRNRPSKLSNVHEPVKEPGTYSVCGHEALPLGPSADSARPPRSQKIVPSYRQGAVFHTQWLNNGPSSYYPQSSRGPKPFQSQSRIIVPQTPGRVTKSPLALASAHSLPVGQLFGASISGSHVLPSLVTTPTVYKESYIPGTRDYLNIATSSMQESQSESIMRSDLHFPKSDFHQQMNDLRTTGQTIENISESLNVEKLDIDLSVLDSSRAPLKHLTGILAEFRGEDGSFFDLLAVLWDYEKRQRLFECLGNQQLILRNPFEAAMGISLLSRLGFL